MLDQGRLPATDPFSFTAGETPWILQEYGSQVVFARVEQSFGIGGLRVLGLILSVGLLGLVFRRARCVGAGAWTGAAVALFAALFALKWELRPHLLSAFFVLAFEAWAIPRVRRGPQDDPGLRVWMGTAIGACAWVQLHAEALFAPIFALGLLAAAAFGALTGIDHGSQEPKRWRRPARTLVLFVCALGGTLLSPLGVEPHRYALFRRSVPQQYIEEWFPGFVLPGDPRFVPFTWALFGLVATAFVVAGVLAVVQAGKLLRGRTELSLERLAFLAICLAMAFEARRFLWLLWFPCLEVLVAAGRSRGFWAKSFAPLGAGLATLAVLATTHYPRGAWRNLTSGRFAEDTDRLLFPVGPADVLAEIDFRGHIYHPYEWGGYLGARLWPAALVFLDARTVLFEEIIPERWLAERDPAYASQVFEERDVAAIVFKRLVIRDGQPVAWRPPDADRLWIRAFADAACELWIRSDRTAELAAIAEFWEQRGVPFDPSEGFVELAAWIAAPPWSEEFQILPEIAADQLAGPSLERARSDSALATDWLDLAERAFAVRLGRSARLACRRALERSDLSQADREVLLSRLSGARVPEWIAAVRQVVN